MANKEEVKKYLAYWFQLGKKLVIDNGMAKVLPQPVYRGNGYSPEFEEYWQKITAPEASDCYLEGTHETVRELLTPAWVMMSCSRCTMPVPLRNVGMPPEICPCHDLPGWPNTDIPTPRSAVNSQEQLKEIRDRLIGNFSSKGTGDR